MGFLPLELSYKLTDRKDFKDSAKGRVARIKNEDFLLQDVTDDTINERCEKNPFKPHKYRSYLGLLNDGFYEKILYDQENSVDQAPILLARCKNKKIVVTSMTLDQTEQNELLKNILRYIIKGIPSIAFVGVKNQEDDLTSNFNNLYYTTKLAKYATQDYESFSHLELEKNIHNIYIVSPSISNKAVSDFWDMIKESSKNSRKNVKIYRIEESVGNEKIIREFSNYSAVDLIIDKAFLWINSTFDKPVSNPSKANETYFGKSFWISYDTLLFFDDIQKSNKYELNDIQFSFLVPILNKIAHNHFRKDSDPGAGSYDGVYNCSCAMVEIFKSFSVSSLSKTEYGKQAFYDKIKPALTTAYVIDNFELANLDDKLYAVLSLRFIYKDRHHIFKKHSGVSLYDRMIRTVYDSLIGPYEGSDNLSEYALYNEIDICRQIRFMTLALEIGSLEKDKSSFIIDLIYQHILRLYTTQTNGKWQSVSKTAIVLKTLIKCINRNTQITDSDILMLNNLTVTKGINYLVSAYKDIGDSCGNWDNDLLASVNAAHALLLYDLSNNYTIKDYKDTIARESLHINALNTTIDHVDALATLRNNNSTLYIKLEESLSEKLILTDKVSSLTKDISDAKEKYAEVKKKYQDRFELRMSVMFAISIGCVSLFLFEKFDLFKDFSTVVKWTFSFVISGLVTGLVKRAVDLRRKKDFKDLED